MCVCDTRVGGVGDLIFASTVRLNMDSLHCQAVACYCIVNMCVCVAHCLCIPAGRCSVLVKVSPDLTDIFMGHTTWWTYTAMTRLYKHYTFGLHGPSYKVATTSMSSYPGMVTSMVSWLYTCTHNTHTHPLCAGAVITATLLAGREQRQLRVVAAVAVTRHRM